MTAKNSYHIVENETTIRVNSLSGQDTARKVLERMGTSMVRDRRFRAIKSTKDHFELESAKGARLSFRIQKVY